MWIEDLEDKIVGGLKQLLQNSRMADDG